MDARIPLLFFTMMLCPSLAKAGLIVHPQSGPSVSQARGTASIQGVVSHQDQEHKKHIRHAIPAEGLATFSSSSAGAVVVLAVLTDVATLLPIAELRWQAAIRNPSLPHIPLYRPLLKPS